MNKKSILVTVVMVFLFCSASYGQYCSASGGCDEYIYTVEVGTINNSATGCSNYADYTSISTTMEIGSSYPISVVTAVGGTPYGGYEGDQCGIWVDWNQDGDFYDSNETVYTASGYGLFTTTITPPADALVGDTRMRVRLMYTGTLSPCGGTTYGEVEDYTITILPEDECHNITVGTGTSAWAYPMHTFYHDNRTQVIYLASEIGEEGTITALGLDVETVPGQTMNNWTIRMKHTTMSSYSTASLDATEWTIVYQGNEPIGVTGWRMFDFSTPFEYNGTDNLLVDFSHNNTYYTSSGFCSFSVPGGTRSAYADSDSLNGDPLGWSGTTSPTVNGSSNVPNVQFTICGEIQPTVSISGYVKTSLDVRIKGVNISASTGETTVTDALGYYELSVPSPFSGTVTPSQTDWTFSPTSKTYSSITINQTNQDFTATYLVSYGGGFGTSSFPYLIYNAAQLNAIGAKAGDWSKHFRLMADIDLSGYDGEEGRPSFNRIGYYINFVANTPFTGVFDGGGHTISNFTFDSNASNDGVGIFGYLYYSVTQVKDVKLTNVDVSSTSNMGTGGLVGHIYNATVSGCSVQGGSVSGDYNVGGLVGMAWYGTISDCYAEVNVSGNLWVGGLQGAGNAGAFTMSDCHATCVVTGGQECGGLIGKAVGSVTRCSSAGSVTVTDRTAGGLVGSNSGIIEYCFSTANATGVSANEIGGLVGRNLGDILNSYAMGSVSGYYPTGGLVGLSWKTPSSTGNITNNYSTGASNGAGLIGQNIDGVITGSFWDVQTSGKTSSDGGTGKTTEQMQDPNTFINAGWDFVDESVNGDLDIWRLCNFSEEYPHLNWEYPLGDFGCPDGVNMFDFAILGDAWFSDPDMVNWDPVCDISEPADEVIDGQDLAVFVGNWLEGL
jgi:hypothetical protein